MTKKNLMLATGLMLGFCAPVSAMERTDGAGAAGAGAAGTAGAEPAYDKGDMSTLLHKAVLCDDADEVSRLIDAGADINTKDSAGITPLLRAVFKKKYKALDVLCKRGANVKIANKKGQNPLHFAAAQDYQWLPAGLKALAETAVDAVNAQDIDGNTPLHYATHCRQIVVIGELVSLGADRHIKNKKGISPDDLAFGLLDKEFWHAMQPQTTGY